jgi:hypothetical protein
MLIVAVAVTLVAAGAGCGASEDSDPPGLSRAVFVKRASAACLDQREHSFEKIVAYEKKHRSDGVTAAELTNDAMNAAVLSTVEAEIAALGKLHVPAREEEAFEGINALMHDALDKAKGEEKLAKVEAAFRGLDWQLRKFGLPACAKNG